MSSPDVRDRATTAARAAAAGAAVAGDSFRTRLSVDRKDGKTDVVTQTDRDAQEAVFEAIRESHPAETLVGEEGDAAKRVPPTGPAWIVDPIDGTNNYVDGIRAFGTAVAAVVDADPVAGAFVCPALGDTYRSGPDGATLNGDPISVSDRTDPATATVCPTFWWVPDRRDEYAAAARELVTRFDDVRRFGCAQLELAMVAAGALDGAMTNVRTNPWDTVAGVHAIREAGGTVTDLEGDPWRHDSRGLVASNGEIHDELLDAASAVDDRT